MESKYIYLVFSKTGTWLSRSIGIVTKSPYTHVALSLDSDFKNMYTFGRLNPDNPFIAGLTVENLHTGVYKKFKNCESLIYKVLVSNEQYDNLLKNLNGYFSSDINYRYNFLGLFTVLMDKPWKRETHYFCSQFVSEVLIKSDIWNSPKVPELTQPIDLTNIPNKELVFQGLVNDFTSNFQKAN